MTDPQRPSEDEDKTVEQPSVADETPKQQPAAPPPVVQAPPRKGGFRRFAGHRATQLVAVGALGFVLGGGIIGTAVGLASRDGDRPGFSREHRGPGGHGMDRDFRDGPGWRDQRHGG
ncbi:hypothetical protein [Amycolatopsis keratiniphila]|uniref:Uncharacterized protein n=1 Tax=Amycolatopsis keratiniphila subsp. keratiniphila TaxID=227715 RepID=A0A1W2LR71_9PSEU|nr:hypothetical protein [Amycolatopsis keratiniphila]ONF66847.1 hypothetical protein AVR91_0223055 [Amycolatopsis keratiniphila subsp. keratiniphila]